jgi:hypothetical protein
MTADEDDERRPRRPRTRPHRRQWRTLREFLITRPSHGPTRHRARPRFLTAVTFAIHSTRFRNARVLAVCSNVALLNARYLDED